MENFKRLGNVTTTTERNIWIKQQREMQI